MFICCRAELEATKALLQAASAISELVRVTETACKIAQKAANATRGQQQQQKPATTAAIVSSSMNQVCCKWHEMNTTIYSRVA